MAKVRFLKGSYSDRKRVLKWVLLVTVPQTVLDATASLRTASVRQDHRQYCVLVLRTHPVGSVVSSEQANFSNRRLICMQGETTSASVQTETTPQTKVHPHHYTRVLFHHEPHQYQPRNVNRLMEAEKAAAGFNTRVAVALTKGVGTMWTAYTFTVLAFVGLLGLLNLLNPITFLLATWVSQQFLQLVLLPVIMVGQNVLGRKTELQADEQFHTTMSTYHDIEQIMQHLSEQDAELLHQTKMLIQLLEKNGISLQQLEAEAAATTHLDTFVQPQPADSAPVTPASTEGEKPNT